MAPLMLEGETLGDRHRHYNKLLEDVVANKAFQLATIDYKQSDLNNLLMIDVASRTRNVEYIIEVLKCDDMLYVSRAIKQSTWLITDPQYAHIFNPEYLYLKLFPYMKVKAINKLMLHIRLNLKDEKRVETFYDHLKDKTEESYRWLENCSEAFICNVIKNERHIPLNLFKRLCKRSSTFAKYYKRVDVGYYAMALNHVTFLLKSHTDEYMKLVGNEPHNIPTFNRKATQIIMKKNPNVILDNFENYANCVDAAVVAKHLKKDEIKEFLLKHIKNENLKYYFNSYDNLKYYIKNIAKEERFEFIRKLFIDKSGYQPRSSEIQLCSALSDEIAMCDDKCGFDSSGVNTYEWYKYAPFNVAFVELKKLVRAVNSPAERVAIFLVLIACAGKNPEDIKKILQYYHDKHINEAFKFKIQFVNSFLKKVPTHKFDAETWYFLDQLFHSMEVYIESENNVQNCLKNIVLYKVIHDEKIPDIVEKKREFYTFKQIKDKLNEEEKNKLFAYLLNDITAKLHEVNIDDNFETIHLLNNALKLLRDWNKALLDYPFVLDKINELILIKKDKTWKSGLSSLYNLNKSWRKDMFEVSLLLHPTEEVCLNALKHDPKLLMRHSAEVAILQSDDSVSLRRLLSKLRVYWPHSIAQQWADAYLQNMMKSTGTKAAISGLFTLLSQEKLIHIVKSHVPEDNKIKWSEADPTELSLRKNIAKSLHIARPLPTFDSVLWYAKGDYLQYTVPSLNAILHNLSKTQSREIISKLLDAPVSLQKYGLHLAFNKLNHREQKEVFFNVWKKTKNSSIRLILFTHTYKMMCKGKALEETQEMWDLLSMFIDNLSAEENKNIYKLLSRLPDKKGFDVGIQADIFMKSYIFLTSLPAKANCESFTNFLLTYAPTVMPSLSSHFVVNKLLSSINEQFSKPNSKIVNILSSYILHGKTEEEQLLRYKTTWSPLMAYAFQSWNEVRDNEYNIRTNFNSLLKYFAQHFKRLAVLKTIVYPTKLFKEILNHMEQELSIKQNYVLFTSWKLTTAYVNLVEEYKSELEQLCLENEYNWRSEGNDKVWEELHNKLSPAFGTIIGQYLKEDVGLYFHTIYLLFNAALSEFFDFVGTYNNDVWILEIIKNLVTDQDFVPTYLLACEILPSYGNDEIIEKRQEIIKILASHPSDEVKMHYFKMFGGIPEKNPKIK